MSDTVKLIIEIPTDFYEITKAKVDKKMTYALGAVSIAQGTLLDDVKAKVELLQSERYYFGFDTCKNRVLEILNNIGKTESEGT